MGTLSRAALAVTLGMACASTQAANSFGITFTPLTLTGDCNTSSYNIETSWTNDTVDAPLSYDLVTMLATDEDGLPLASDWTGSDPGETSTRDTDLGFGSGINEIVPNKNITIEIFDSVAPSPPFGSNFQAQYDDIAARPEPAAFSLTFNPGDCSSAPVLVAAAVEPVPVLPQAALGALAALMLLVGGFVSRRRFS